MAGKKERLKNEQRSLVEQRRAAPSFRLVHTAVMSWLLFYNEGEGEALLTRYGLNLGVLRRNFSSTNSPSASLYFFCKDPEDVQNNDFPNAKEFPLPGQASSSHQYTIRSYVTDREVGSWQAVSKEVMTSQLSDQRQVLAIHQFVTNRQVEPINVEKESKLLDDVISENTSLSLVVTAQTCPELLKREFSDLFPNLSNQLAVVGQSMGITVINLVQRTDNDMAYWSQAMETEREKLTADFIAIASRICDSLKRAGYWADFIDPSSGRPYLGPFTNATLFETDERYRYFGFQIDDLGCCKVVKHPDWGTKAFTGTIFTSAPLHSPRMKVLLDRINAAGREREAQVKEQNPLEEQTAAAVISSQQQDGSSKSAILQKTAAHPSDDGKK